VGEENGDVEVIWVEGEWESWRHLFFIFPNHLPFLGFPSQFPNKGKNAQIQKDDQR